MPKAIRILEELQAAFEDKPELTRGHVSNATLVRLMLASNQPEEAEVVAMALLTSVSEVETASDFSKTLANLSLGLAKIHNVELDEAGQNLEFVHARRALISEFSSDELAVIKRLLEALVDQLEDLDSNTTLFDPVQWRSVLDSI